MGFLGNTVRILTRGVRHRGRHEPPAKSATAQTRLARARAEVAGQQAAAIAKALREDPAHGEADLEETAEEEAEALPWSRPPGS